MTVSTLQGDRISLQSAFFRKSGDTDLGASDVRGRRSSKEIVHHWLLAIRVSEPPL
jgi:hypothetical protein